MALKQTNKQANIIEVTNMCKVQELRVYPSVPRGLFLRFSFPGLIVVVLVYFVVPYDGVFCCAI